MSTAAVVESSRGERTTETSRATLLDRRLSVALATAWILLLLFAAFFRVTPWPDILLHIDFSSYWTGASLVRQGAGPELFDPDTQYRFELNLRQQLGTTEFIRSDTGFNPYPNPPPLALLYLPLTLLPFPVAYALWAGINLAAFWVALALPLRGKPLGRSVAILMLSFVAVTHTLFEGQPYGLFALVVTLGLLALRSDRPLLGGVLLGLLWLKPQYAVLLPVVFLHKGRWRELAGFALTGAAVLVLSVAMVGLDGVVRYVGLLRQMGGFSYRWVDPWSMVNWRATITAVWSGVPDSTGGNLVLVLGAATVAVSLLAWSGDWRPSSSKFGRQMLVSMLAVIVAAPHSHILGAALALPPLAFGLHRGETDRVLDRVWMPLLLFGYLWGFATWPLGHPRWPFAPYFIAVMALLIVQCRQPSRRFW